jgi:peptidoglycan-associated lipoprotein
LLAWYAETMTLAKPLAFRIAILAVLVSAASLGCDNKATAPAAKSPATLTRGDMKPPAPSKVQAGSASDAPPGVDASVVTNGLHVSDTIARACALPQQETRASFDFDSTDIGNDDREVLALVAKCLTEGALQGRSVSLVGRADPRGENEYNMSLGGTRAEAVRKYLHDLGVQRERLGATSRGEIDATGTDETGWARDRRVDIELVN